MRRYQGKMNGERYLADKNVTEVHDLDNEQDECQIDDIITNGYEKPYFNLKHAQWDGFRNCLHCIKGAKQ